MEKLLLRPEDAAEVLSIGRSAIYELMKPGELPSVKIGRSRRITVAAVEEFLRLATQPEI